MHDDIAYGAWWIYSCTFRRRRRIVICRFYYRFTFLLIIRELDWIARFPSPPSTEVELRLARSSSFATSFSSSRGGSL